MNGPTPFQESNVLLLVQEGDIAAANKILSEMHPNELRSLERAASKVEEMCFETIVGIGT
jgi:hypothetical protein